MTSDAQASPDGWFKRYRPYVACCWSFATRHKAGVKSTGTGIAAYGLLKLNFGPTWPDSALPIAVLTGMLEWILVRYTYLRYKRRGMKYLLARFILSFIVFLVVLLFYIGLQAHFVMRFKDGSTETRGWSYTETFKKEKQAKEAKDQIAFPDDKAVWAHGGKVEEVFTAGSVYTMRGVILVTWFAVDLTYAYAGVVGYILWRKDKPMHLSQ